MQHLEGKTLAILHGNIFQGQNKYLIQEICFSTHCIYFIFKLYISILYLFPVFYQMAVSGMESDIY